MRRIRETRRAKKFTQRQLSIATGLQQSSISRLENGKQHAKLKDLNRIARALGVPVTQLIES
jgi:transcriptional regulator with XRE-family HTH domain